MGIVQNWLVKVALKKGVTRGVMAVAAYLASDTAQAALSSYGISIDSAKFAEATNVLSIGIIMAGLEFVRNWAKKKKGLKLP